MDFKVSLRRFILVGTFIDMPLSQVLIEDKEMERHIDVLMVFDEA